MEDNRLASELLQMQGITSKPATVAMATYYSPTGKAYAWQITFSLDRWDRVAGKLGLETEAATGPKSQTKKAVRTAARKAQGKASPGGRARSTRR